MNSEVSTEKRPTQERTSTGSLKKDWIRELNVVKPTRALEIFIKAMRHFIAMGSLRINSLQQA
jgi:hypothetical protein